MRQPKTQGRIGSRRRLGQRSHLPNRTDQSPSRFGPVATWSPRVHAQRAERLAHDMDQLLAGRATTIYDGTREVQLNVISERTLGLPRDAARCRAMLRDAARCCAGQQLMTATGRVHGAGRSRRRHDPRVAAVLMGRSRNFRGSGFKLCVVWRRCVRIRSECPPGVPMTLWSHQPAKCHSCWLAGAECLFLCPATTEVCASHAGLTWLAACMSGGRTPPLES